MASCGQLVLLRPLGDLPPAVRLGLGHGAQEAHQDQGRGPAAVSRNQVTHSVTHTGVVQQVQHIQPTDEEERTHGESEREEVMAEVEEVEGLEGNEVGYSPPSLPCRSAVA